MFEEKNLEGGIGEGILKKIEGSIGSFAQKIVDAFAANTDISEIAKTIVEVDNSAISIAKSFGQGKENVLELSRAMADAVTQVTLLGGNFGEIAKIQEGVSSGLNRNLILTSDSYEKLYAAQEVSGKGAKEIVTSFKDAGFSAYQSATQMEKVVNVARSMGVNAQAVSGVVLQNMDALNKFNFEGGVQGLAKMAAQASMLRIDMTKTLTLADDLFSPDKAIELAASMQRLGVANSELLDPLRLMDMAQNDPAELQNQIAKMSEQFVQLNKNGQFEIMPGAKRQLREIATSLGMNYNDLSKMAIGTKELDMKMQQIKFPDTFTEDQKMMIANMAEMGKDGQFKISMDGKATNLDDAMVKIRSMSKEEQEKFFEATKEKTVEQLAKEQLTELQALNANLSSIATRFPSAVAGTKVAKDALRAPTMLSKTVAETVNVEATSIKNLREGFDENAGKILGSINKLLTGEGSVSELLTSMSNAGKQFESFSFKAAEQASNSYVESVNKLKDANNQFIDILINAYEKTKKAFVEHEKLGGENKTQEIKVKDVLITTLPEDKLILGAGTNLNGNNNMQGQTNQIMDVNVKHEITLNAPPNVDTAQLALVLQTPEMREKVTDVVKQAFMSKSTQSNSVRAMNQMANATGLTGIPARTT